MEETFIFRLFSAKSKCEKNYEIGIEDMFMLRETICRLRENYFWKNFLFSIHTIHVDVDTKVEKL